MTITPELKQALRDAGEKPVRIEDPETKIAYLIITEENYRRLVDEAELDRSDQSLYEFEEFHPIG